MSVIVKAGSDICRANTNTSTAKFQYTIPKAKRFPEPKFDEKRNGKYQLYYLPSTLSKRYTKFGYGTKSDFTRGDKNYKPNFYNIGTDFDQKNPHGPKYSFANGREKYGKVFLETAKPFDKNVPGPGKYNILKDFGSDAPKVSFKGKYDDVKSERKKQEDEASEGDKKDKPFSTITIQIRPTGKYSVSQIPNVNSLKFDKDKSRRTKFIANKNPGPGTYESKPLIGRVFPSQYRSYEPISFALKHNFKDSRSNYPGPGSYIIPSDFGIYQSKDADKYPKENVYVEERPKPADDKPWRHGMKKIKPKPEIEENNEDNNDYNDDNNGNNQENNEEENKMELKTPEGKEETKNNEDEKKREEEEKKEEEAKKEEEVKKEEDKKVEEKKEEGEEEELPRLREILQYPDAQTPGA